MGRHELEDSVNILFTAALPYRVESQPNAAKPRKSKALALPAQALPVLGDCVETVKQCI